jgi:hypothetical protein
MSEDKRSPLRKEQDRLLALLRRIPLYRERWSEPLEPGGPSPADLEAYLCPEFDSVRFRAELEAS